MDSYSQWEILKLFSLISGMVFAVFSLAFHLYDNSH
jgi:hypothetical protein